MRYHVIVNPSAGRGRAPAAAARVAETLRARGHEVTSYEGAAPGDITRHVAGLADTAIDRLLIAGGDGTLRAVLDGRRGAPPWPLGILPVGTANLVAREIGMTAAGAREDLGAAVEAAVACRVNLLALEGPGRAPQRVLATVGVGLDAHVVHAVARLRGAARGSGGYHRWVVPILREVLGFEPVPLEIVVDGRERVVGSIAIVQNARCWGGLFSLSPTAAMDRERFEVVVMEPAGPRDLVRLLLAALLGRFHRDRRVRILHARHVRISAPRPVPVQADGDPAGFTDVEVRLLPGALTLLRPTAKDPARA